MFRLSLLALIFVVATAPAAVLTIGNMADTPVSFKLSHPGQGKEETVTLKPGEHQLFVVGKSPVIAYTAGDQLVRFQLDPYTPYVFGPQGKSYGLQGVELAAAMPGLDKIPVEAPQDEIYTLKVKIYADDASVLARAAWEKLFRERITTVSTILEKQCKVKLEVVEVGEFSTDKTATTTAELLASLQKSIATPNDWLHLGFSSRQIIKSQQDIAKNPELILPTSCLRGPLGKTILLRETLIRSESARTEMLLHEIGHHLGAVHSPDKSTSMRSAVLDGRSDILQQVRAGLDPINLLIVGVWLEELRTGKVKAPGDISELSRERLKILYKTLQNVHPEDTLSTAYVTILDKKDKATSGEALKLESTQVAGNPGSGGGQNLKIPAAPGPLRVDVPVAPEPVEPMPNIAPPMPANPTDPKDQAIRAVVRAITTRAKQHRDLPKDQRARSDSLTADYIRIAAEVASQQPEPHRRAAFLIGLGIGLDDSTVLRKNILKDIARVCQAVESDSEFAERVAFLGLPTMRYRRDLCQHFFVSAALTELLGVKEAESIGLAKELLDSTKSSGFSFPDLCADYAGVAWASKLKAEPTQLELLRKSVNTQNLLPSVDDLPEGLTNKRFQAEFGGVEDSRFLKLQEELRARIAKLHGAKK